MKSEKLGDAFTAFQQRISIPKFDVQPAALHGVCVSAIETILPHNHRLVKVSLISDTS